MAEGLVRESEFFRTKQERHTAGCKPLANLARAELRALEGMLDFAVPDRCGSHDQRAIGNRLGHGPELLGAFEDLGSADG